MENRITTYISIWGSMILALNFENKTLTILMIIQTILLLIRYIWLFNKE